MVPNVVRFTIAVEVADANDPPAIFYQPGETEQPFDVSGDHDWVQTTAGFTVNCWWEWQLETFLCRTWSIT